MKRRVFGSIFLTSLLVLAMTAIGLIAIMYGDFTEERKNGIRLEAFYIKAGYEMDGVAYLSSLESEERNRITLISADGQVLFDNYADADTLPTHSDRPEVEAAFREGSGEALRDSDTLRTKTYYYALKLSDGNVLRLSATVRSIYRVIDDTATVLFLIIAAGACIAAAVSVLLTKKIIKPINSLNLDEPLLNRTYDELAPLLLRMNRQNTALSEKMSELNRARKEFSSITDNMSEALTVFGSDKKVITANRSACLLFDTADAVGKTAPGLFRDPEFIELAEKAFGGRTASGKLTVKGRIYGISFNPVDIASGGHGAVMLAVDITERENAEARRREFSANVSHELKTPLTSISGYAEIIENGIAKPEDIPGFAGLIRTEAARLLTLVQDIMNLSRLDEGIAESFTRVDISRVCREVCALLAAKAEKNGVSLHLECGADTPVFVSGIESTLKEMAYNLCDNAIIYNRKGGNVWIKAAPEQDSAVLTVRDDGIGIAPEDRDRVFERFYRADKGRSKEKGGTGLGLSIVKHGAQLHHASVSLESAPGVGTEIKLIFPSDEKNEGSAL